MRGEVGEVGEEVLEGGRGSSAEVGGEVEEINVVGEGTRG